MGTSSKMLVMGAIVLGCLVAPGFLAQAQDLPSAEEILNNYVKAIGGEEAINKIENRMVKADFSLPAMGMQAMMEVYIEPPNYYTKIEMDAFGTIERGITGDTAWEMNPMQGNRILEGAEKEEMMRQASLTQYADWNEYYESAEVLGEDTFNDNAVYHVKLTPKGDSPATTLFFDKETHLIVGGEGTSPQGMPVTTTIGDYKEVDGVKVAHKIENSGGQFDIAITYSEVKHNTDIPEGTFDMPEAVKSLAEPAEASN